MHSNLEKKNNRNTSVFIDASNIGSGGGIAHIKNLLSRAPSENITYTIWIDKKYLKDLPQKDNFEYKSSFMFNLPFPMKFIWKIVFFRLICIKNKPIYSFLSWWVAFFQTSKFNYCFSKYLTFCRFKFIRLKFF